MTAYSALSKEELRKELDKETAAFEALKARGLKLDMSRGKPGKAQLDLVMGIFDVIKSVEDCNDEGLDARNYGTLMGLPSARRLFAELLGVRFSQVLAAGNSSLTLMYDTIAQAYAHGLLHSEKPWCKLDTVKFLCPSPGYDRHFRITEAFGIEMIPVPMRADGPDMDTVEEYVKDPAVKGIWCVPKYTNPEGIVYSDAVVRRFGALKPAAPDFIIMWDNAYCVHEFDGDFVPFLDILSLCEENARPDMVIEFASTSKITLPGAGISCMAMSEANMAYFTKLIDAQVISFDKVNQLRHVLYLKDKAGVLALMKRHAQILKPKFDAVLQALEKEIAPLAIARWNQPKGGYFVTLDAMPGTAKRTLALCKEAGVVMTSAGATYPYGLDPKDGNIRIAPTLPSVQELDAAIQVFCVCLKRAALEKLLG